MMRCSIRRERGSSPIVYLPVAQAVGIEPNGPTEISVGVRPAVGSPMQLARSVGAAIIGVDPGLAFTFRLLTDHVDASVRQERIVAMLSGLFGGLALLIAALGLYGVTSYTVSRRFTEIGIRMALGAQRAHVLGLILRQSLALTAIGIGARSGRRIGGDALCPRNALRPHAARSRNVHRRRGAVRRRRRDRGSRSRRTAPPESTRSSRCAPTEHPLAGRCGNRRSDIHHSASPRAASAGKP